MAMPSHGCISWTSTYGQISGVPPRPGKRLSSSTCRLLLVRETLFCSCLVSIVFCKPFEKTSLIENCDLHGFFAVIYQPWCSLSVQHLRQPRLRLLLPRQIRTATKLALETFLHLRRFLVHFQKLGETCPSYVHSICTQNI